MELSKDEKAIVEQALLFASLNSSDYQEITAYETVLNKFKAPKPQLDGFRYDYDDNL
ncbi:hypothetical protein [Bacillus sp. HMF5848]|uniref:hypothetical protein n=1 Tax=Bacillus sp. HMF5848 TaxID=2495421 RepID=UPI00163A03DC|nr:hypothetical protein [Bacillus sp. HMF5848]